MARLGDVIEGLQILARYAKPTPSGATGKDVQMGGAEHDIIYGPDVVDLPASEAVELESFGWFVDSETDTWARYC